MELKDRILNSIVSQYDRKLIQNDLRGVYAEHMVAALLGDEWCPACENWGPWDLQHQDGCKLEVKQSAARQTWTAEEIPAENGARFGIRAPKGYYEGIRWTKSSGRLANIYVFAWQASSDDSTDHRDPAQWAFYVVKSDDLPDQKSIGLKGLNRLTSPVSFDQLRDAVELLRNEIEPRLLADQSETSQGNLKGQDT